MRFQSDSALAQAAGREWLDELTRLGPDATYCVALPGGRIAQKFFSVVTDQAKGRGISLAGVHFFWGDERCVPVLNQESNFRIAHELLLGPLEIGSSHVHRVPVELPPDEAAVSASVELCRIATLGEGGLPTFDMIFLGMGEDGHVASLFPGESEDVMNRAAAYRSVVAVKPPPNRITLGYGVIAAAEKVWVLASGKGKETALKNSLTSDSKTPLGRVIRMRQHTRIFTDQPEANGR